MQSLLIAFAKMVPEDKLLDDLEQSLREYRTTRSEDSKSKLALYSMFITTRLATEGKDLLEVLREFDEKKRGMDLFATGKS